MLLCLGVLLLSLLSTGMCCGRLSAPSADPAAAAADKRAACNLQQPYPWLEKYSLYPLLLLEAASHAIHRNSTTHTVMALLLLLGLPSAATSVTGEYTFTQQLSS